MNTDSPTGADLVVQTVLASDLKPDQMLALVGWLWAEALGRNRSVHRDTTRKYRQRAAALGLRPEDVLLPAGAL